VTTSEYIEILQMTVIRLLDEIETMRATVAKDEGRLDQIDKIAKALGTYKRRPLSLKSLVRGHSRKRWGMEVAIKQTIAQNELAQKAERNEPT
jgi:hypothetical protein